MAFQETDIANRWLYKWRGWGRLFRQQTGMFFAGQIHGKPWTQIENGKEVTYATIKNFRPVPMGVTGLHDHLGWHSTIVTPEMVGHKIAIASSIEWKTKEGRVSDEQRNFMTNLGRDGGISFVVRSEDDRPMTWEDCQ